MSMSTSVNIEKLTRENYDSWKMQVEAILVKNDLWGYVDGSKPKPVPTEDNLVDVTAWEKMDRKAKADIVLSVSPSELCHIKNCATSTDAWTELENVYASKGPAKKATLLKQLLFKKLEDKETMAVHLNKLFSVVDKLRGMNVEVSDDILSILILYSVPSSYENFRCAIESRDILPDPQTLKIKLLEESEARKRVEGEGGSHDAFYSKQTKGKNTDNDSNDYRTTEKKYSGPKGNSSNKNYKPYKCNYCQKIGHKASNCWKKKGNTKQEANQAQEDDAFMVCESNEQIQSISALGASVVETNSWCLDSGATSHMCNNKSLFSALKPIENQTVGLAADTRATIEGIGVVKLPIKVQNKTKIITCSNVLFVPELKTNLLSVAKIADNGKEVIFNGDTAVIMKNGNKDAIAEAYRTGDLYFIKPCVEESPNVKEGYEQANMAWHLRYGHLNETDLRNLATKNMVDGLDLSATGKLPVCETCIKGKQTATPFPQSTTKSEHLLDLIHSDVCGPMRTTSIGGAKYFVTFTDNKSKWIKVYFLKSKDEVRDAFLKFKAYVENEKERKVKTLRTDNGLEYCDKSFDKELEQCGIKRERTTPYTPQQNGVAERLNRTLVEMARCMLIQANLPKRFWAEAIYTAAYIRNRCPTKSLKDTTPFEVWHKRKPNVSHLRIFGCTAYALNKNPNKDKLNAKSKPYIFLGYAEDSKAYRLWDADSQKIIKSRDVTFLEETSLETDKSDTLEVTLHGKDEEKTNNDGETSNDEESGNNDESQNEEDQPIVKFKRGPGRPKKVKTGAKGAPRKVYNLVPVQHKAQLAYEENPTVQEALEGPNARDWIRAIEEEYNGLVEAKAWIPVQRPIDKNVIGNRWVLKTKYRSDGTIERRKARLVAKGYAQQPGIDFMETYAPVARTSTIRTILALTVEWNLTLYQLDVEMAYINGELDEDIHMEHPDGFKDDLDTVLLLKKALYGLKQSGKQWFKKLDEKLKSLGLKSTNADMCFYYRRNTDKDILLVAVYVDDIIVATNQKKNFTELKEGLGTEFKMKDLGALRYCLGMEFIQNVHNNVVFMFQKRYIGNILQRFGMDEAKPALTPLEPKIKLTIKMCPKDEKEKIEMKKVPYRQLIGSLMYAATCTRPDISYSVSMLSRFNENPGREHWKAAKRVLRYLKGTASHGMVYSKSEKKLYGYVDSDWGSNVDDRISQTGHAFKLNGSAITWESRKQKCVALSSVEAEYVALTDAAKEAVYLRGLLKEIGMLEPNEEGTLIYCDNQGAQKLLKNPTHHSKTKHIDIRYHFVREIFQRGDIRVEYLPTQNMVADILTKSICSPNHVKLTEELGVVKIDAQRHPR